MSLNYKIFNHWFLAYNWTIRISDASSVMTRSKAFHLYMTSQVSRQKVFPERKWMNECDVECFSQETWRNAYHYKRAWPGNHRTAHNFFENLKIREKSGVENFSFRRDNNNKFLKKGKKAYWPMCIISYFLCGERKDFENCR
jgi:hypothetical protein